MSAEGWAWITLAVFGFWFIVAMIVGFACGIAGSWAHNAAQALLAAVRNTAFTAVACALAAALATGVKVLWLS